jgi:hypothetical protein
MLTPCCLFGVTYCYLFGVTPCCLFWCYSLPSFLSLLVKMSMQDRYTHSIMPGLKYADMGSAYNQRYRDAQESQYRPDSFTNESIVTPTNIGRMDLARIQSRNQSKQVPFYNNLNEELTAYSGASNTARRDRRIWDKEFSTPVNRSRFSIFDTSSDNSHFDVDDDDRFEYNARMQESHTKEHCRNTSTRQKSNARMRQSQIYE